MRKITVTVAVEDPDAVSTEVTVAMEICRDGPLRAGSLGLSLAEAKRLLRTVQDRMVRTQLEEHVTEQRRCHGCGARRWIKD